MRNNETLKLEDCDITLCVGKEQVQSKIEDGAFRFNQGVKGPVHLEFALSAAFFGGETDFPVTVEYISKSKRGTHDIKLYISIHDGYYEMKDFVYAYGTGGVFDENEKPKYSLDAEQITLDGSALQFIVKDIN